MGKIYQALSQTREKISKAFNILRKNYLVGLEIFIFKVFITSFSISAKE